MSRVALENHLQRVAQDTGRRATVAFFDLDRTLIAGYSIVAMARERIRSGLTRGDIKDSSAILAALLQQQRSTKSGESRLAYHRLVKLLSKGLKGISEDSMRRLGEQAYSNSIARTLYSEAIALVEAHRQAGHRLVIVTAATRYQVDPIARVLGVDEVCCTGLEVSDGRFTGQTLAPLCFGEGKVLAARRVCKQHGASLKGSWFYSDSSDDLPLLRAVGKPVAVNPSAKLAAQAEERAWPQLQFATRGNASLESVARTLLTLQTVGTATAVSAVGNRLGLTGGARASTLTRLLGDIGSGFAGLDIELQGAEHLAMREPAVFIFNHQSMLDAMVLAHVLKRDVVGICKKEMADNPLMGALLRQVDTIFVDREETNQAATLKKALAVLRDQRSILIAPEGTRSTLGEIQPFKHGAFYLAKKASVPVVPIVLHNVKDALPNGGLLIKPTTIRVTIMDPLHPAKMGGVRQACEQMEQAYSRVLGASPVASLPAAYRNTAQAG
ncbi:MAG: HAD-IB family hydrolase [Halioglobus sp.]|nr:HAD-IB family hydrolase [Halioglobus sp.]